MVERNERTSELFTRLARNGASERISIGAITEDLGDRGFGILLCLWALPSLIPIPGISTPFGLLIVMTAGQMVLSQKRPWLPDYVQRRSVARGEISRLVEQARPYIERLERYSQPRFEIMRRSLMERLVGLFVVVLGMVLMLPIWGGNLLPAIAVAIIGIGLMERDGVAVLAGCAMGLLSLIVVASIVGTTLYMLAWIWQSMGMGP